MLTAIFTSLKKGKAFNSTVDEVFLGARCGQNGKKLRRLGKGDARVIRFNRWRAVCYCRAKV